MPETVFNWIYLVEFILISTVRSIHTSPYRREKIIIAWKNPGDLFLLILAGISMLLPLVYIFSSVLSFADYRLPDWTDWVGALLFLLAIWLLWRSHADLGRNWTPTLGIRDNHQLVTGGIFRWIRHPMYAAHLLWGVATVLMIPNWLAGFPLLIVTTLQYLSRVRQEEEMMLVHFGEKYRHYQQRTGRILPRFGNNSSKKK